MLDAKQVFIQNPDSMYVIFFGNGSRTREFSDYEVARHCLDVIKNDDPQAKLTGFIIFDKDSDFEARLSETQRLDQEYRNGLMESADFTH